MIGASGGGTLTTYPPPRRLIQLVCGRAFLPTKVSCYPFRGLHTDLMLYCHILERRKELKTTPPSAIHFFVSQALYTRKESERASIRVQLECCIRFFWEEWCRKYKELFGHHPRDENKNSLHRSRRCPQGC